MFQSPGNRLQAGEVLVHWQVDGKLVSGMSGTAGFVVFNLPVWDGLTELAYRTQKPYWSQYSAGSFLWCGCFILG